MSQGARLKFDFLPFHLSQTIAKDGAIRNAPGKQVYLSEGLKTGEPQKVIDSHFVKVESSAEEDLPFPVPASGPIAPVKSTKRDKNAVKLTKQELYANTFVRARGWSHSSGEGEDMKLKEQKFRLIKAQQKEF